MTRRRRRRSRGSPPDVMDTASGADAEAIGLRTYAAGGADRDIIDVALPRGGVAAIERPHHLNQPDLNAAAALARDQTAILPGARGGCRRTRDRVAVEPERHRGEAARIAVAPVIVLDGVPVAVQNHLLCRPEAGRLCAH